VDGRLILTGPVADEAARTALLEAAASVVDPANIDDRLEIVGDGTGAATGGTTGGDTTAGAAAADLDGLVSLVRVMPPNLVAGTVTRLGDGTLSIEGTYVDDAGRDAIADAADAAGVASADVVLDERAEATVSDAARLTEELNDFVAANPILFQPNSANLTAEASAVVDQVAAIANRYAGVAITVEGHTDTDGDANRNLQLSAARAQTVQNALLERGVTAPMEIAGFGETQPILANGVEDKAASRRVVFQVSAT
jgi:OOP family OmpA-OmpF porin